MISENLFQSVKLLSQLDAEIILGKGDSEESDTIRDKLSDTLRSLSFDEYQVFSRIALEKVYPGEIRKRLGLDV